jgi:hypothetical protein
MTLSGSLPIIYKTQTYNSYIMKKNILTLIILIITSITSTIFSQVESRFINMHFIPEGELVEDSVRKVTFNSFWISNQITNSEFREFWNYALNNPQDELIWAEMSLSKGEKPSSQTVIQKIKYSELVKDALIETNWPIADYFVSQEFNSSPVIGVSENLAKYFCIWKTSMVYESLDEKERESGYTYYVPSSLQTMYARKLKPTLFSKEELGFRIVVVE